MKSKESLEPEQDNELLAGRFLLLELGDDRGEEASDAFVVGGNLLECLLDEDVFLLSKHPVKLFDVF